MKNEIYQNHTKVFCTKFNEIKSKPNTTKLNEIKALWHVMSQNLAAHVSLYISCHLTAQSHQLLLCASR
jgi:hypothetical protein